MLNVRETLELFFSEVSSEILRVSHGNEGPLAFMPSWQTSFSITKWGITPNDIMIAVRVVPDEKLSLNKYEKCSFKDPEQGHLITDPLYIDWDQSMWQGMGEPVWFENATVCYSKDENPMDYQQTVLGGLCCVCNSYQFKDFFSAEAARRYALDSWAQALENNKLSYAAQLRNIVGTLKFLLKLSKPDERRIHRYINYHKEILLPAHDECYFEHPIYVEGKDTPAYKADFVLDMGTGNRALLIELENQKHKIYKKNGDLRAELNHAVAQTTNWSKAITEFSHLNATGDFRFLLGGQDKMVVAGTGMKHEKRLNDTKQDSATILTYDLLINNAVKQLNKKYKNDSKMYRVMGNEQPLFEE